MGTRPARSADESGLTIIEILVAMGIFAVVTAVFMGGVVSMSRTTARALAVSDATSSARKVLDRFDKEVRYSTAVNMPGTGAVSIDSLYVEYLIPAQAAGAGPVCVQWRYDSNARTMARRTWTDSAVPVFTVWDVVAINVRNPLATNPPFVFAKASALSLQQQLTVSLDIGPGTRVGAQATTAYIARNTSVATKTNLDLDHNNRSDDPVCQVGVGRP